MVIKGGHLSEEVKAKLRAKALTPERIDISLRNLPKNIQGDKNPFWGRHHSEETKSKLKVLALTPRRVKISIQNLPKDISGPNNPMYGRRGQIPWNLKRPNIEPSPTLAHLLGMIMGDGSVFQSNGRHIIKLTTRTPIFNSLFEDDLRNIGLHTRTKYIEKYNRWETLAVSKSFYEWYKGLSIDKLRLLLANLQVDFIRGFYEAEGSLCCAGTSSLQIKMYNTNYSLLELVNHLLTSLGFRFAISNGQFLPSGKKCFTLSDAKREDVVRFYSLINPSFKRPEDYKKVEERWDLIQQHYS